MSMSDEQMNDLWYEMGADESNHIDADKFQYHVVKFLGGSGVLHEALHKAGKSSEGGRSDVEISAELYLDYLKRRVSLLEMIKKQKFLFQHKQDFLAHHQHLKKQEVSIIGAPMDGGQVISGCQLTPGLYRSDPKFYNKLRARGWTVNDFDLDFNFACMLMHDPTHVHAKNAHAVGLASQMIYEKYVEEANRGNFVLTLGGDHSIGLGTLAGAADQESCCVFFVDAHGDTNIPEISPSGNFHGMPVGCHLGLSDSLRWLPGWDWFKGGLNPDNVVFIGLRDLDQIERDILHGLGCHVFTPVDILQMGGIRNVVEIGMERVNPNRNKRVHLSFDIDACDPLIAPSTGCLSPGGLSYVESLFIPNYLWETGCLCSMDLAEVNTNILQGAIAGKPELVITKDNIPEDLHEIEKIELRRNPHRTLMFGWKIVMRGLGMGNIEF